MIRLRMYLVYGAIALLAFVILLASLSVTLRLAMNPYMFTDITDVPGSQVAMVLGASVVRGVPSQILQARADAAIALYNEGKVQKILVTGDNGALSHDEVTPVRKYLLDAGIAAGDIFLDHAGFDTYSSMYRARDVFTVESMIIVTQDFHLPRAVFLARHLGIEAYGLAAAGREKSAYDYSREIPASVKALGNLLVGRVPKYLGDAIPITGDGSTTWY